MAVIAWILLGLVAGFIGSKLVNNSGRGMVGDVLVGIVGALAGGFLFNLVGSQGVSGLNLWSLFVSIVGSVVMLLTYHAVRGSRVGHAPPF